MSWNILKSFEDIHDLQNSLVTDLWNNITVSSSDLQNSMNKKIRFYKLSNN